MPDQLGNISVPEIVPAGTFPIVPDYPHGRAIAPDVRVHQFGSGNAKIEQRFVLGTGAKRFIVRRAWLRESDRVALRDFWETKYGPYGAFTYNAPSDDGGTRTPYTCRFANEPLSWEMVADHACTVGVTLIEIPAPAAPYVVDATLSRFPSGAMNTAMLPQVQQFIPLLKIQPLQAGYPAIYLSDGDARSAANCTRRGSSSLPASSRAWAPNPTTPRSRSATPTALCATWPTTWTCTARAWGSRFITCRAASSWTCGRATSTLKTVWHATLRRAKVPYFRIYDLRSTYATRLSAGGVADEWVTQLLRQGDAKVFKKYSQMKLQMKREALQKLNRKANEGGPGFDTERAN